MMEHPTTQKRSRSLGFEESGSKRRNTADGPGGMQDETGAELCKDYTRGQCDRGSTCKFRHPPDEREVCHDFLSGRCHRRANSCKFFHDYDQLREREAEAGGSNNQSRAGFARVIYEDGTEEWVQRERIKPDENPDDDRDVCHDYQRGICSRGRTCKFRHTIETCREYANGNCRRGESCKFTHGGPPRDGRGGPAPGQEVCRSYLRGQCRRGRDCRYYHDVGQDEPSWTQPGGRRDWGPGPAGDWSGRDDMWGAPRGPWGGSRDDFDRFDDGGGSRRPRGEVCNDFQRGKCTRGRACKYSHDAEVEVCREFQRGGCSRGSTCKYQHPMPEICNDFTRGKCTRGDDCRYSHATEEEYLAKRRLARAVCMDYTRGRCTRGESCKFSHEVEEQQDYQQPAREQCMDFKRGKCLRGDGCKYAHEAEEVAAVKDEQGQEY